MSAADVVDVLDQRQRRHDAPWLRIYVVSTTGTLHRSVGGTNRLGWTLCNAVGKWLHDAPAVVWADPSSVHPRRTCRTCERIAGGIR